MRVYNQPAYALVSRPYSETSLITELFTREYGRIAVMAKGARRLKSKYKAFLQPFQPLLVGWTGKGEVPTLTGAEIDVSDFNLCRHELQKETLVCGFYCNELLVNFLHRHDPHPALFDSYQKTLFRLNLSKIDKSLGELLRAFEQTLIKEAGYEISFLTESDGRTLIDDESYYLFRTNQGFQRVQSSTNNSVQGRVIKSLHGVEAVKSDSQTSAQAKVLMREILSKTLNDKRIVSRDLLSPTPVKN